MRGRTRAWASRGADIKIHATPREEHLVMPKPSLRKGKKRRCPRSWTPLCGTRDRYNKEESNMDRAIEVTRGRGGLCAFVVDRDIRTLGV